MNSGNRPYTCLAGKRCGIWRTTHAAYLSIWTIIKNAMWWTKWNVRRNIEPTTNWNKRNEIHTVMHAHKHTIHIHTHIIYNVPTKKYDIVVHICVLPRVTPTQKKKKNTHTIAVDIPTLSHPDAFIRSVICSNWLRLTIIYKKLNLNFIR